MSVFAYYVCADFTCDFVFVYAFYVYTVSPMCTSDLTNRCVFGKPYGVRLAFPLRMCFFVYFASLNLHILLLRIALSLTSGESIHPKVYAINSFVVCENKSGLKNNNKNDYTSN